MLQHAMDSILLARLLILQTLREKFDGLTALNWLWIQLHPNYMLKCDNAKTVFGRLWLKLKELDVTAILGDITETENLVCFVDEAQVLLTETWELSFPCSTASDGLPLFTEVAKSLLSYCAGPILSGTGLRMYDALDARTSSVAKYDAPSRQWTNFRGLDQKACLDYLTKRLGDEAQQDSILPFALQGPPRFSANFVAEALRHPDHSLDDVLTNCVKNWTTAAITTKVPFTKLSRTHSRNCTLVDPLGKLYWTYLNVPRSYSQ